MNKFVLIVAAIFVAVGASATAQVVISDLTVAEKTAILADPNNTVVATAALQIEVPWDIGAGLGANNDDDLATVAWQRNQDHGFNLVYNGSGNFELTITPPSVSPITVSVAPTGWYNQLLFTITSKQNTFVTLDLSGNIDGTDFRDLQAPTGTTDGLRFDFPNSTASDVAEFAISGVFTPNSLTAITSGDFSGEFILVKNSSVPEPTTIFLLGISFSALLLKRPLRKS